MLSWIREKFGPLMIGLIVGLIGFVFVVSGVFNPKRTAGMGEGSVAGMVNGEPISITEFNRELNRRMEFFKGLGGGNLSEAQLKAFHIKSGVFGELVNRKLMSQAANKQGMMASDEEVRAKITEIPAFQKNSQFDPVSYKNLLAANNYTPSGFEKMMREDLSLQNWSRYFRERVKVSDDEIKREFMVSRDKRNIKYVLLTHESAAKTVQIPAAETQKFLNDPAKLNIAKNQFESRKNTDFKGKTFEQVKEELTREILASEKTDEIRKINEGLAKQVESVLKSDKASDGKVNAMLKPYGVEVKNTGLVAQTAPALPGIGEARDLMKDAFAAPSPIEGKAKVYNSANWWLVAEVSEAQKPDLSKLDSDQNAIRQQLIGRKERDLYESWIKDLSAHAKIERNESIVGEET